MYDGALIDGVIRIDHLGRGESEEGVDGDENDANRIAVNGTSPLKVMVGADEKGGSNISFPERRKGSVVGLVD